MTDLTCPTCGGDLSPIGVLGVRLHLRCRGCGLLHSRDQTICSHIWERTGLGTMTCRLCLLEEDRYDLHPIDG